ncbi:MAG TPA: deoxyribodipyrimidine photo-lyase [Streptosporangiaceae bacterium]|nr:deoxyribodipyrimidine photo-lyase [Streptosporangiaceae bacterium]
MISVVVFTRDLRVADNPALSAAVARSSSIVPLFVLDDDVLAGPFGGHARRLGFLLESLADLDASLRALGGELVVRRGAWVRTVMRVALLAGAGAIHLATDVSGYASARLTRLRRAAAGAGITVLDHPGVTVVPPGTPCPPGRAAYQVFTPYYRGWLAVPRRPIVPAPRCVTLPGGIATARVPELRELTSATPAPSSQRGGERAGLRRLRQWAGSDLARYPAVRDDLGADQTSRLSAYLHLGCLSPAGVAAELRAVPGGDAAIRQLAWRDFFCQLLAAHPHTAAADFRKRAGDWADDADALAAWQAGQTGYPVVDAGMRQLAVQGFMHPRARMITASFLTKDLYLDWRLGAAHFLRHLVDGDLACNQLNWQWVAGTGTDTRPARMLSPVLQSRRHDPEGGYIRRWVPELAHLPAHEIHEPGRENRRRAHYPEPIIDHHEAAAAWRARRRPVVETTS